MGILEGWNSTARRARFFFAKGSPIVSPTEAVVIRTGSGASAGNYVSQQILAGNFPLHALR